MKKNIQKLFLSDNIMTSSNACHAKLLSSLCSSILGMHHSQTRHGVELNTAWQVIRQVNLSVTNLEKYTHTLQWGKKWQVSVWGAATYLPPTQSGIGCAHVRWKEIIVALCLTDSQQVKGHTGFAFILSDRVIKNWLCICQVELSCDISLPLGIAKNIDRLFLSSGAKVWYLLAVGNCFEVFQSFKHSQKIIKPLMTL